MARGRSAESFVLDPTQKVENTELFLLEQCPIVFYTPPVLFLLCAAPLPSIDGASGEVSRRQKMALRGTDPD